MAQIVEILSLSSDGNGVAKTQEGLVIFVPLTCPGDICEIEIIEKKKNFAKAKLTKLIQPSQFRVSPRCQVFGECGGCDWQHVQYDEQLRQKNQILQNALTKLAKLKLTLPPIIAGPQSYSYRRRVQVHIKGQKTGFNARGSHRHVPTRRCEIAAEKINATMASLSMRDGIFELDWNGDQVSVKARESGLPFTQINTEVNRLIIEHIAANVCNFVNGIDLFAGEGNFALALARHLPQTHWTAVEKNPESVKRGIATAKELGLAQVSFLCADVHELQFKHQDVDLAIVDPPREGLFEQTCNWLNERNFAQLVYVSCNPATLARDLARLDYDVKSVQAFDMFPQTAHVEAVALLMRRV